MRYQVKLTDGQNNGLFLDMANGRQWIRERAEGARVLNLFSYSCSFSVAALAAGASQVVNIDMSHGALKLGKINHQLNELPSEQVKFLRHDIFKSWGKLKRYGPYQVIVCDPPTSQFGSFVAAKDYAKLVRRIPQLAAPGADLLMCLNAPELPRSFITELMATRRRIARSSAWSTTRPPSWKSTPTRASRSSTTATTPKNKTPINFQPPLYL